MTTVDVSFPIVQAGGIEVPRDHGYTLYAALSRAHAVLHEAEWLAIHPLSGKPAGEGRLSLTRESGVRFRIPLTRLGDLLPLVGTSLDLQGATLTLGPPSVHPLVPSASLDARLVVVKLTDVPKHAHVELGRASNDREAMAARVQSELVRQLAKLEIASPPELLGHGRIHVAGHSVIGFTVRVQGLDADQSLRLQAHGLGGKRRMGCGVFRPTRGA